MKLAIVALAASAKTTRAALLGGAAYTLVLAAPHGAWAAADCGATGVIVTVGTTQKLIADCTTTTGVVIPSTVRTFSGQDHTITGVDPAGGAFGDEPNSLGLKGFVVTNRNDPDLTITNLGVQAPNVGGSKNL